MKDSGQVIGSVGCSYYDDLDEIGITYFIGHAAESIRAYRGYFFSRYTEAKLIATIREDNVPSWKTVEKCSFRLVARKMYQDLGDDKPLLYRFCESRKDE